jgi:HPt (histidine-containing phosphotransfer) domain-containing protein
MIMSAVAASMGEIPSRPALPGSRGSSGDEPTIDLVHLARQTDNDPALEDELLALFDRQSASILAQLSREETTTRNRADAAHMLRGSALAIGAGAVARAAQAFETSLERGGAGVVELEALAQAVGQARAAIARLRG